MSGIARTNRTGGQGGKLPSSGMRISPAPANEESRPRQRNGPGLQGDRVSGADALSTLVRLLARQAAREHVRHRGLGMLDHAFGLLILAIAVIALFAVCSWLTAG